MMKVMVKHLAISILGRVQGVGFRHFVKLKALELGLSGFARNEARGTLYIEAEGEEEGLKEFLKWCKKGPPVALVQRVEVKEGTLKEFLDFITL